MFEDMQAVPAAREFDSVHLPLWNLKPRSIRIKLLRFGARPLAASGDLELAGSNEKIEEIMIISQLQQPSNVFETLCNKMTARFPTITMPIDYEGELQLSIRSAFSHKDKKEPLHVTAENWHAVCALACCNQNIDESYFVLGFWRKTASHSIERLCVMPLISSEEELAQLCMEESSAPRSSSTTNSSKEE